MPNYRRAYVTGGTFFLTVVTCPLRKGGEKRAQRNRDEPQAWSRPTFHQPSLALPNDPGHRETLQWGLSPSAASF